MDYYLESKPVKKRRYTIGFLDENAYDEYHGYLMAGVFAAARKYDMNVIRFGHFAAHITYKHDFHINMVLNHVQQYHLDGLLFLGWARVATMEEHTNFKERFRSIPILSVGAGHEGIPSVYFQGNKYIHEILLHLIEIHSFKRIAFIAPFWPDDRTGVYIDTMKKYGIYHPELFVAETEVANLEVPERGRKAVSILLDERKASFDAIVSLYNDETKAIVDELRFRGLNVPCDIAVTSYEDGEIGRFASPAFTTAYFPWKELGYCGCEKMFELLTQGHIPMSTAVPGKVILRDSCGCISNSVSHAKAGIITSAGKGFGEITESELTLLNEKLSQEIGHLNYDASPLCQALIRDFHSQSSASFLSGLETELRKISDYFHFLDIEDIISVFRRQILPYVVDDPQTLVWAENLFQQAQVLVQEKKTAVWAYEAVQSETMNRVLQEIGQVLVTNFSLQKITDSLEANLPKINLPGCYIFIFKEQENPEHLFDDYILAFQYSGGQRINLPKGLLNRFAFRMSQLLASPGIDFQGIPPKSDHRSKIAGSRMNNLDLATILFPENRPYALNSQLLHVGDKFMGFVIFEPGPMDERVYQVLSLNISTALFGVILLEKLDNSYKKFVEQAHRSGMAEIASGILHNVSNILNSVSVSIQLIKELIHDAPIESLVKANQLLEENIDHLDSFLGKDPRGKKLTQFYIKLGESFNDVQTRWLENIYRLAEKINLINDIVTAQQNYTGIRSTLEELDVIPIIEDALKMNLPSLEKYHIKIVRNYDFLAKAFIQRTKLFHVLVNLITNAKDAMLEVPESKRKLVITTKEVGNEKQIRISDTGHGISPDLLESIFAYGYTTKKDGHGFGLHSCANYMTEMEGKIWAESDGPGKGASFILQFK
jgi:signal transduction histidine kinase/DNA-binding LacI/PurR family transcriptional regulator